MLFLTGLVPQVGCQLTDASRWFIVRAEQIPVTSIIRSATRKAWAAMVRAGFTAAEDGKTSHLPHTDSGPRDFGKMRPEPKIPDHYRNAQCRIGAS